MTLSLRAGPALVTGDEGADVGYLLELVSYRPAWQLSAACRKPHPGVTWFPEPGHKLGPAKAICAGCPALAECRDWSIRQGSDLKGIWGGMSGRQREVARSEALRLVV